jgi:hypothetical protein
LTPPCSRHLAEHIISQAIEYVSWQLQRKRAAAQK